MLNSLIVRRLSAQLKHRLCYSTKWQNQNLISQFPFSDPYKRLFKLYDGSCVSTDEFLNKVGRFAGMLTDFGLVRGDRVVAQVDKSVDNIALYLAALKTAVIYVPLNTAYTEHEVEYFLNDAEPKLFLCSTHHQVDKYQKWFQQNDKTSLAMTGDDFYAVSHQTKTVWPQDRIEDVDVDTVASLCYTSGTTGKPKGAMITHGNLTSNSRALIGCWDITEYDVLLHVLPTYHVHGLFVAVNTILMSDASFAFQTRFDADLIISWLRSCTLMMGVPTYYSRLLLHPDFDEDVTENIRLFISGSAPLLPHVWHQFKDRTGHEIVERYGMTEAQMICSNPVEVGPRVPGTVGKPLHDIVVRVDDGNLQVKGPNIFRGYWRMPEKTANDFTNDSFFITGDLASISKSDGYVRILGREKDLVISGGLNIYPKEIELCLDALPEVEESAIIGVAHSDFGEAVVAVVVPAVKFDETNVDKLYDTLVTSLQLQIASFKMPKEYIFVHELPRNAMGKVEKKQLREQYRDLFGGDL